MVLQVGNQNSYRAYIPDEFHWYKRAHMWKLQGWISLYLMGNFANGFDNALVNGLQILPEWEKYFHNPEGSALGLLGAIQNIGSLGSIPIAPFWNDYFGRRKTVMLGGALMLTGAALQAASKNVNWFLGGRAMVGFGGGFNNNADPLMCSELAYPSHRVPISGSYNSFTNIGSIVAAATTFATYYRGGEWSWRLPLLIQVIPTSIQWSLAMFGPESPRWLISKGRDAEALRIMAKYHGNGDEQDPMVLYEYDEVKKAIASERENKRYGWTHLFNSPGMRRRSYMLIGLAVCSEWSGNSMVSYYLNQVLKTVGITDKPQQLGINLGLTTWNWTCAFTAGFNADKIGRRKLFLTSVSGMLACFTCVTICSSQYVEHGNVVAGKLTVFFIFCFTGFYALAWSSVLSLYTTEIMPFSMRAKGHSFHALCKSGMQTFSQYVNPVAFLAIGWKYYIIFDLVIVGVWLFIYFFLHETRGHTLEETALVFDGARAVDDMKRDAEAQVQAEKGRQMDEGEVEVKEDFSKDDPESLPQRPMPTLV